MLKNVLKIFFDQRRVTTEDFFIILLKMFKDHEDLDGLKPYQGGGGMVYKRVQEILKSLRLLGVLTSCGVQNKKQMHCIDVAKVLDENDLRLALIMNKSPRLVNKIRIVHQLYPEQRDLYIANEETEDDEEVDAGPQPQDRGK